MSEPEILRRKPRLKCTPIPVGLVLGYLAAGKNGQRAGEQIVAGLDYARDLGEFEAVV